MNHIHDKRVREEWYAEEARVVKERNAFNEEQLERYVAKLESIQEKSAESRNKLLAALAAQADEE